MSFEIEESLKSNPRLISNQAQPFLDEFSRVLSISAALPSLTALFRSSLISSLFLKLPSSIPAHSQPISSPILGFPEVSSNGSGSPLPYGFDGYDQFSETDADLVTFIEWALARISAAHTHQDIVHNDITDLHHGPIQPSFY